MAPKKTVDLAGYQYSALSSQVTTADRSLIGRRLHEPTGEAESLAGRIDPRTMGSRAGREHVVDMEKKRARAQEKQAQADSQPPPAKRARKGPVHGPVDVLSATVEFDAGLVYRPRTAETRATFELLLSLVHRLVGDMPSDVVRSGADLVVQTLKDPELQDHAKRAQIAEAVDTDVSPDTYTQLLALSKKLYDYDEPDPEADAPDDAPAEEDTRVAVMFDRDEENNSEAESEVYQERLTEDEDDDEDEDSDDENRAPRADSAADQDDTDAEATQPRDQDGLVIAAPSGVNGVTKETIVQPSEVDAFYLQRLLGTVYPDEHEASEKADQAFSILAQDTSIRDLENELMDLFDYDHLPLVKLLTANRDVIVWCTRLARADEDEGVNIEVAMREGGFGSILKSLRGGAYQKPVLGPEAAERARKLTARATLQPGTMVKPRKVLDLGAMAFAEGARLKPSTPTKLPANTMRTDKPNWEEIHVPAPVKRTVGENELVAISSMPAWAHKAFPSATRLNPVQSKCYPIAFGSDEPMLLCAPTGAGKTNVAMLTILHELEKWRNPQTGEFDLSAFKIVYVAPMKALVAEQAQGFRDRLEPYGIVVKELTGDSQLTKAQISETQVIVTTPEKWDVVSRKSSDTSYTNLVRLMIVDEIHLLHDDRGPVLEAIVARTIRRMEHVGEPVRLVGLSATLPNYRDVATFLRVNPNRGLFYFDGSYRPAPLAQLYIGIKATKAIKRLHVMNEVTYEKAAEHVAANQVLIFVHSRKETAKTAKHIKDTALEKDELARFLPIEPAGTRQMLLDLANGTGDQGEALVADADLRELIQYGFGIHHAGMSRPDRDLVEELFRKGVLKVLVSTATLAWGVNLPAHTVIIKGTQVYNPEKGRWVELSPQDMLQMLGRAGRPQYDTFGEGIIITNHTELGYYLSLLNEQLPIESQFVSRLADNLNAEIVLGTVRNRDEAVAWLGYTYLYVRMLRTPTLYSVTADYIEDDPFLEQKRADIVHSAAVLLEKSGMIAYDRKRGIFTTNDVGRIASHFYIAHTSMATYNTQLKPYLGTIELLRVFALSDEFKYQVVRQDEKLEVGKLLERVPVPVKETVEDPVAKINVLLQTWISQLKLDGYVLAADMVYVTQSAGRILRALFEICLRRGYARLSRIALDLCKMVQHRMWGSMTPLRQYPHVPPELIRRLERKEFPWDRLRDLEANELGELINLPKAGRLLHKLVNQFPRLELQAFFQPITRSLLHVQLTITPDFLWDMTVHGGAQLFHILVEDCDGEMVLHHETFVLLAKYAEDPHTVTFTIPLTDPTPPNYYISVVSDRWLHAETRLPISFLNLILPDKFDAHTVLVGLEDQDLATLKDNHLRQVYAGLFPHLNKIQSQTHHTLFDTDDTTLVAAPAGSGKTVCAELAMVRSWRKQALELREDPDAERGHIVCLVPFESMIAPRIKEWQSKFGTYQGGKIISPLSGEASADLRALEDADVVVCTPTQWDVLSRRWRQRKHVQLVDLYIADDVHLVGDWKVGPTYEVVLSRARFVTAQTGRPTRIVGLSVPLANARDVGDWLGVSNSQARFNFSPAARPTPLEVQLQSFNIPHYPSMMLAMAKPAYLALLEQAEDQPALLFVPSRKQAKATATDLLTYIQADADALADPGGDDGDVAPPSSPFLHIDSADLEATLMPRLVSVDDADLKETLPQGIGLYYAGMSERDRRLVEQLYTSGAIQVVIAEKETVWSMPFTAHLVILLSLQGYDGREHRYVDYTVPEVLQMVGKSTVASQDDGRSKALLLAQATRKDFFRKFLAEAYPLESRLYEYAHDFFNAEVVARTVENKQEAVDILTWTLMFRRLQQNPQAYRCQGRSRDHLSDYLSELVESTLTDLEESKCIAVENEVDISPLNLGMIASFYNVSYLTVDVFNLSLNERTKMRHLLEIVTSAAEFDDLPIRQHEEIVLGRIYARVPYKLDRVSFLNPYHKAFVLLQAHFARLTLPSDLALDQRRILSKIITLLSAAVDVMSSNAHLKAILAMELAQMCVQAVWERDSPLRQVPYFDAGTIERCAARNISDVYELADALAEMDEGERDDLLRLDMSQLNAVAQFTNTFPYLELNFEIDDQGELNASDPVVMRVTVSKGDEEEDDDDDDDGDDGLAVAPFFPQKKLVHWWLLVGDPGSKSLLGIKRVALAGQSLSVRLEFSLPAGTHDRLQLYLLCDSYQGADRVLPLPALTVAEGEESSEEDEDEDEDDDDDEAME